jgi:REP element-mobilizing transposase RayT
MEKKYQNKYRIPSARAQWWDYGWNGAYFITLCTQNRAHFFGKIQDKQMVFTPLGAIADVLWHEIPHHDPFVELGDFVVMPNHLHGILILDKPGPAVVETLRATSLRPATSPHQDREFMSAISPKPHSISAIIRSYKSAVTKHANRLGLANGWQPRFHDRIIRNDAEYQRISDYIVANPSNWDSNPFNPNRG